MCVIRKQETHKMPFQCKGQRLSHREGNVDHAVLQ